MSKFVIPKGKDYTFTVTVYEVASYLYQNLTNATSMTFQLFRLDDAATKYNTEISGTIVDAINGKISFTLPDTYTDALEYERGDKVDGYYLKPAYQGVITVEFSDSTPTRVAPIDKIYVSPTGA